MDYHYDVRIISEKDLIDAGCFNIPRIIQVCEEVLMQYVEKQLVFPEKVSTIFDVETQNRINCLPAAILPESVYGMKWVSVFPQNPHTNNKPNVSAVILLSELETGYPVAFLEGGMITNLRTASLGAIAAKYLARKDAEIIGMIGAGDQSKSHFLALKSVLPSLKVCKIASRTLKSEMNFIEQMKKFTPDVEFIPCHANYETAARDSDVIVTAISGQEKILQADWIKKGAFYVHVGGLEDDFAVPKKASKIVCDDWNTVKHRTQTISQMYQQGLLKDSDIYANIYELVSGQKKGRENDEEFTYFNSVGLAFIDIKVANWMFKKAVEANLGQMVTMKDESIFEYGISNFKL